MFPTKILTDRIRELLAADTATIAHGTNAVKVKLVTNDFTPSAATVIGDLTICAVTGLTAITGVVGAQNESVNPLNGNSLVELKAPAGGWRWESGVDAGYPVTIKGIAVTSSDGATLLASARLPDGDVTITDENQVISLGSLEFEFNNSAAY